MARKPKLKIANKLAALAPSQTVKLSEFFPDGNFGSQDIEFEVYRQGHSRVVNGLMALSTDPAYEGLISTGSGNGEAPASVDLAKLQEFRAEQAGRLGIMASRTVLGRVSNYPTDAGPISIGIDDEDRDELLVELFKELPMWFSFTLFARSQRQETALQEAAAETAGKS